MATSSEHLEFIQAIQAEPDDDTPRWVYADWLEDQGDPLGEFIRVQCTLGDNARRRSLLLADVAERHPSLPPLVSRKYDKPTQELKARESELLEYFDSRWVQPLKDLGASGIYLRRGFVDEIHMLASNFTGSAEQLLEIAPALRILNLRKASGKMAAVLNTPVIERIRGLDLRMASLQLDDIRSLSESEGMTNLKLLSLQGNRLGRAMRNSLLGSSLNQIETLNLAATRMGYRVLTELLHSSTLLQSVRELILWRNPLGQEGIVAIARWNRLSELKRLDLRDVSYDPRVFYPLCKSAIADDCELILSKHAEDPKTQTITKQVRFRV